MAKSLKSNLPAEIAGWYGMIAILLSYALVSFAIIPVGSVLFQMMNITGCIGLLWIAYVKKVYQSVILNIIWGLIGVIALVKILFY